MLFNANKGAAERKTWALLGIGFLVWLSVVGAILFVAGHFISKYW